MKEDSSKVEFEEISLEMVERATEAYISDMDPDMRGGIVRDAVRGGMWMALDAAFNTCAKCGRSRKQHINDYCQDAKFEALR